jgi:hypothetical protein
MSANELQFLHNFCRSCNPTKCLTSNRERKKVLATDGDSVDGLVDGRGELMPTVDMTTEYTRGKLKFHAVKANHFVRTIFA